MIVCISDGGNCFIESKKEMKNYNRIRDKLNHFVLQIQVVRMFIKHEICTH